MESHNEFLEILGRIQELQIRNRIMTEHGRLERPSNDCRISKRGRPKRRTKKQQIKRRRRSLSDGFLGDDEDEDDETSLSSVYTGFSGFDEHGTRSSGLASPAADFDDQESFFSFSVQVHQDAMEIAYLKKKILTMLLNSPPRYNRNAFSKRRCFSDTEYERRIAVINSSHQAYEGGQYLQVEKAQSLDGRLGNDESEMQDFSYLFESRKTSSEVTSKKTKDSGIQSMVSFAPAVQIPCNCKSGVIKEAFFDEMAPHSTANSLFPTVDGRPLREKVPPLTSTRTRIPSKWYYSENIPCEEILHFSQNADFEAEDRNNFCEKNRISFPCNGADCDLVASGTEEPYKLRKARSIRKDLHELDRGGPEGSSGVPIITIHECSNSSDEMAQDSRTRQHQIDGRTSKSYGTIEDIAAENRNRNGTRLHLPMDGYRENNFAEPRRDSQDSVTSIIHPSTAATLLKFNKSLENNNDNDDDDPDAAARPTIRKRARNGRASVICPLTEQNLSIHNDNSNMDPFDDKELHMDLSVFSSEQNDYSYPRERPSHFPRRFDSAGSLTHETSTGLTAYSEPHLSWEPPPAVYQHGYGNEGYQETQISQEHTTIEMGPVIINGASQNLTNQKEGNTRRTARRQAIQVNVSRCVAITVLLSIVLICILILTLK